jgi:hypothetical protein
MLLYSHTFYSRLILLVIEDTLKHLRHWLTLVTDDFKTGTADMRKRPIRYMPLAVETVIHDGEMLTHLTNPLDNIPVPRPDRGLNTKGMHPFVHWTIRHSQEVSLPGIS